MLPGFSNSRGGRGEVQEHRDQVMTPMQLCALVQDYHAGATITALAARFGLTYYATRERLLAEGVTLRRVGPTPLSIPPGMAAAYRNGSTIPELAERHGLSFGVARRMLLAAGVTLRKPGQRLQVSQAAPGSHP
ncbi:helix-turn-helix domain-containing protein [Amycolatopsis sp. EV170708-02-1]|uniref:helix-turn-helix domain-containing protein n=1 Tax=Amycolatopsis sp. EV170708-02-1 TaxID=2919322 RepID=UPI0037C076D9